MRVALTDIKLYGIQRAKKILSQNGIACENYVWLESGRPSEKDIYFIIIKQEFNDANGRMKGSFALS
jgi:hypothetical protein